MWDSYIVAEAQKTITLMKRVNGDLHQVKGYWVPFTNIVQRFLVLVFIIYFWASSSVDVCFSFYISFSPCFLALS